MDTKLFSQSLVKECRSLISPASFLTLLIKKQNCSRRRGFEVRCSLQYSHLLNVLFFSCDRLLPLSPPSTVMNSTSVIYFMNGTRTFLIILETRNYISISSVIDDVGAEQHTIDRRPPSFKLSISLPLCFFLISSLSTGISQKTKESALT